MHTSFPAFLRRFACAAIVLAALACGASEFSVTGSGDGGPDSGADTGGDDAGPDPGDDASPGEDASRTDGSTADAGPTDAAKDSPADAPPDAPACTPVALGKDTLAIDEMMIAGAAGSMDNREWVEVRNATSCKINLKGLHALSPRGGAGDDTLDVTTDLFIPVGGTFLIADATDGGLPGPVLPWTSTLPPPTDVLKNPDTGDTVELRVGSATGTLIDSITYMSITNFTPGTSMEFSSTCLPLSNRTTFSSWKLATRTFGLFKATPNAPNDDVTGCGP